MKKAMTIVMLVWGFQLQSQMSPTTDKTKAEQLNTHNGEQNSGELISYYPNGMPERIIETNNGVKQGRTFYYDEQGRLIETGFFELGLRSGTWTQYYENGSTKAIGSFEKGLRNGEWLVYGYSGAKLAEMYYASGIKTGTWSIRTEEESPVKIYRFAMNE